MGFAFLGISAPAFWLGIVLIIIFAVKLSIFPVYGRITFAYKPIHITGMYVLDSSLGAAQAAVTTRILRSSMLEVLRADYVTIKS